MVAIASLLAGCGDDGAAPAAAPGLRTTSTGGGSSGVSPGGLGAGPYQGPCIERPSTPVEVDPLPPGLDLPDGSYPVSDFSFRDLDGVVLAVPLEFSDFVRFVQREWPEHGWIFGQGESEFGEAENNFIRGEEYGGFRARRVYCEDGWSEIVIIVGRDPGAAPRTTTTLR